MMYARFYMYTLKSSLTEKGRQTAYKIHVSVMFMKILQGLLLALIFEREYGFNSSRTFCEFPFHATLWLLWWQPSGSKYTEGESKVTADNINAENFLRIKMH